MPDIQREKQNRKKAGFTLAETLLTVLLLTIVLGGMTSAIAAAVNVYNRVRIRSEAEVLLSTAADAISADLSTARNIKLDSDGKTVKSFFSDLRGYQMTYQTETETNYITIEAADRLQTTENAQNTHNTSGAGTSASSSQETVYLLTKGAQPMGLYPVLSQITLTDGTLSYSLNVCKKDGKSITDTMTYYVRPVTR
jgi:type II secretory pathway pseudopilin PulG